MSFTNWFGDSRELYKSSFPFPYFECPIYLLFSSLYLCFSQWSTHTQFLDIFFFYLLKLNLRVISHSFLQFLWRMRTLSSYFRHLYFSTDEMGIIVQNNKNIFNFMISFNFLPFSSHKPFIQRGSVRVSRYFQINSLSKWLDFGCCFLGKLSIACQLDFNIDHKHYYVISPSQIY